MHNKQAGFDQVQAGTGAKWSGGSLTGGSDATAQEYLLLSDCVGCHTSADANTILTIGSNDIPIVYNMTEPTGGSTATTPLAGGNFYWVATKGDAWGHNLLNITGDDATLASPPGTPAAGCSPCHAKLTVASDTVGGWGIEFGGCQACHLPRHHAVGDASTVVGQDEGWYRFLGSVMLEAVDDDPSAVNKGVVGIEDDDWEQTVASNDHNVYQGTSLIYDSAGTGAGLDNGSIAQICMGCHQRFHHDGVATNEMNSDTSLNVDSSALTGMWLRHPSDVKIPNTGEYASYTTYNPLAPVSRQSVAAGDANFTAVTLNSDVVNCISCHRPHGSPYMDLLRWSYSTCDSGTADADCGCFICHTGKDD